MAYSLSSEVTAGMNDYREPDGNTQLFQRKPLKEELFDILHKHIIAGKYAPGEWLRQEEISSQFGVSQTPVREALDLLVSAGLAERIPYHGVRVLQLTTAEIVDSYIVRLLLESAAARGAALNVSRAQLDELSNIVEQTKDLMTLNDMSTLRQLSREFHQAIVAASGNSLMGKMYQMALNTFPDWMLYEAMFRHPELLESRLTKEYQEHRAILAALAAHDPDLAARHSAAHILDLGRDFEAFLEIPGDLLREKERQIAPFLSIGT
jgi:DNA-binding GntR family transcriptional regulator